jgi:hypothetical protein
VLHELYEKQRVQEPNISECNELRIKMIRLSSGLQSPENIERIVFNDGRIL